MKIAVQGQAVDVEVIRELLSPWNVSFTSLDEAEVVVVYKEKPLEPKKTIVIPSDSADFMKWVKDVKSRVVRKVGEPVFINASSQTVLSIKPKMLYCYDGVAKPASKDTPTASEINEDLIFLKVDIVKEYDKILDETLNAKPSTLYRLLTGLPVPYTLAPERLRDFLMRKRGGKGNLTFCDKLPLDALRFILVRAIEEILGEKLERKKWNGKKYVCIITHDIDTRRGLRRARVIKKLEEKYDVPSAWYIPTKYYKLDFEIVRELANHGEIGSHGTRHDGKLVQLSNQKLVKRLVESKKTLEEITSSPVKGFRAPLLNLNVKMIEALQKACYTYDASVPTWEPKHPYTMKPYGIGTMNLVKIDRIFEIPVSFPQDHQMIHVLGLSARQTVEKWLEMRDVTREIGGVCTILVHPDYELGRSENSGIYEELLSAFSADDHTWITTPLEVVEQRC